MIRKELDLTQPLTDKQVAMLRALESRPDSFDDDCPPLTDKQLSQFRAVAEANRAARCRQTVTLRLSPQALRKAKSLGKGYTSILSRILETALNDPDTIHQAL